MSKLTVECVGWRPLRRNTLVGFAQIRIVNMKMTVVDVALHEKGGARWAALPAKPVLDRDGAAKRDPSTGKVQYVPLFEFDSAAVRAAFSIAAIAAVLELHPDAFEEQAVSA